MDRMIGKALEIDPPPPEFVEFLERWAPEMQRSLPPGYKDGPTHVIVGDRHTGKTRLAMRWLLDAPEGVKRVLVVETEAVARHYCAEHGLGHGDDRVISWRQLQRRQRRGGSTLGDVEYGIDDAVGILAALLGMQSPPTLVTVVTAADWQVQPDRKGAGDVVGSVRDGAPARG